ncbi:MAG: hypothetical protein PHH54_06735 [Candidatus Nanoarchaeia archaeon]|nr:hypothetical protein [Candidatus Nanoarchaeia archaeon]MDD5741651.1 hypothetical protein [Candidatus Nanoarchaeia archaeon]
MNWTRITAIATIILAIAAIFALWISWNTTSQANDISKRAIELQYTPQIAIELNSNRLPTVLTETNYSKADYFSVFRSDIVKQQDNFGRITNTSEVSFPPINITFYNLGSIGTKLERIRYDFSCDPKGERDWQVDIMKNRILLPLQQISYSNYLFLDFGQIPTENKWCSITFKFFFFNNYTQELKYKVWYQNYDSMQTKLEREAYMKENNISV